MDNQVTEKKTNNRSVILVCDDHRDVNLLMMKILKKYNYDVLCAFNSDECIKIFNDRWRDIDLVIMDFNIATLSGPELGKILKTINPDVKFLFTSGNCLEVCKRKFGLEGNLNFIGKPFRPVELYEKVTKILNGG